MSTTRNTLDMKEVSISVASRLSIERGEEIEGVRTRYHEPEQRRGSQNWSPKLRKYRYQSTLKGESMGGRSCVDEAGESIEVCGILKRDTFAGCQVEGDARPST